MICKAYIYQWQMPEIYYKYTSCTRRYAPGQLGASLFRVHRQKRSSRNGRQAGRYSTQTSPFNRYRFHDPPPPPPLKKKASSGPFSSSRGFVPCRPIRVCPSYRYNICRPASTLHSNCKAIFIGFQWPHTNLNDWSISLGRLDPRSTPLFPDLLRL